MLPRLSLLALVLCLGCKADRASQRVEVTTVPPQLPEALQAAWAKRAKCLAKDETLCQLEFASAAIAAKELQLARQSLDEALASIASVFSNEEGAEQARSLWFAEGQKDYKGEPYERAMAYFYRGLIYTLDGEPDNARASFKAALIQDAFVDENNGQPDFGLMIYMQGFASQQMRDRELAKLAWEALAQVRPDLRPPPPGTRLLVLETGTAPRKVSDGIGHYQLKYRRAKGAQPVRAALISMSGVQEALIGDDVYWQAATRGGRPVDSILNGKVQFQQGSAQVTDGFAQTSRLYSRYGALSGSGIMAGAGAVLGLISVASMAAAVSANPEADTRQWTGLSNLVLLVPVPEKENLEGALWELEYEDGVKEMIPYADTAIATTRALEWHRAPLKFRPYQRKP